MRIRLLALLLAAALLAASALPALAESDLPEPSDAAEETALGEAAVSMEAAPGLWSPQDGEDVRVLDEFSAGVSAHWTAGDGIRALSGVKKGDAAFLSAQAARASSGEYTVARLYGDEALNLMQYAAVRFSIQIVSGGSGEEETPRYAVTLTLRSGHEAYPLTAETGGDEWFTLEADLRAWNLRTFITAYEITVSGGALDGFRLGPVAAVGEADLSRLSHFTSFGFTAEGGEAAYADGVYRLDAGRDGTMTLSADAARAEYAPGEGVCALRIVLDDALPGGYLSLSVSEAEASAGAFTIASSCPLYTGENTYLLPYDAATELHAFRLSFRGLFPDGADAVTLRGVTMESFPGDETAYAGRLTTFAFADGGRSLEIAGTIPSATVAQYIRGRIAVYEIPMWTRSPAAIYAAEPLASIKISTKFSLTVDLSGRAYAAPASRYAVVLLADGERIPLAPPQYPTGNVTARARTLSAVGLWGADTAGVFTSNASSVIVDVYLDRLLAEEAGGGRLVARGGKYFYLDNHYLSELDEEIRFCLSADVEVYLRLLCTADLSEAGYTCAAPPGARFFMPDVYREEGANMLCAVTEYLAGRYGGVCGFIAGARMDHALYSGADFSDAHAYAARCADTMRLIYNAAASSIPDVYVLAPLGHYDDDAVYDVAGEGGAYDPVLFAVLLSRAIDAGGRLPWGLLYLSDNAADALGHAQNIVSQMKTIGCSTPHDYLLLWEPSGDYVPDILLQYEQRCAEAQRAGARVLFLSVGGITDTDALYSGLKYVLNDERSTRRLEEYEAAALTDTESFAGRLLWNDFSRSYSTLGWIAGSGCVRLSTQSDDRISGVRTLRAVFSAEDELSPVRGNILCVNGRTDDMRAAPAVVYSLRLNAAAEFADVAELTFIFGSGDTRAEYTATVPIGERLELLCDLTPFSGAGTVDFTAVAVRAAAAVSLDIYSITCCSREADDRTLADTYARRAAGADAEDGMAWTRPQAALLLGGALGSAVAAALLSKRKESGREDSAHMR